jgi:hypothetical protein
MLYVRQQVNGQWGVYHKGRHHCLAAYPTELEAYKYAFGYLNEVAKAAREIQDKLDDQREVMHRPA